MSICTHRPDDGSSKSISETSVYVYQKTRRYMQSRRQPSWNIRFLNKCFLRVKQRIRTRCDYKEEGNEVRSETNKSNASRHFSYECNLCEDETRHKQHPIQLSKDWNVQCALQKNKISGTDSGALSKRRRRRKRKTFMSGFVLGWRRFIRCFSAFLLITGIQSLASLIEDFRRQWMECHGQQSLSFTCEWFERKQTGRRRKKTVSKKSHQKLSLGSADFTKFVPTISHFQCKSCAILLLSFNTKCNCLDFLGSSLIETLFSQKKKKNVCSYRKGALKIQPMTNLLTFIFSY